MAIYAVPGAGLHPGQDFINAAHRFAHEVNENGGSTVHPVTHQFLQPGTDRGYMVGGALKAVPETKPNGAVGGDEGKLRGYQAASHMVKTAIHSGGARDVYAGGWKDDAERPTLDSSNRFSNKRSADRVAIKRNEDEVFNLKKFDSYDPRKGGSRPDKEPVPPLRSAQFTTTKNDRGTATVKTIGTR